MGPSKETRKAPSRAEFARLLRRVAEVERRLDQMATDVTLNMKRIGQVQAELDRVRIGWSKTRRQQ